VHEIIVEYIKMILPKATLREENNGNFTFKIPLEGLIVSSIFD